MSLRPGKTKGPYVGPTAGGAPADGTFVTATDESGTLANSRQLLEGQAQQVSDKGAGVGIEVESRGYGFHDDFEDEFSPRGAFWDGTDAIKSGDWQRVSGYLEGLAETNTFDTIRWRIENDFDYAIDIDRNTGTSGGLYLWKTRAAGTFYRIFVINTTIRIRDESSVFVDIPIGQTRAWVRVVYRGSTLYFYYKLSEADAWTLGHSVVAPFSTWPSVNLALDSCTGGRVYQAHLHDCMFPSGAYVNHPKSVDSGSTSGNITLNVEDGNLIDLTLTGNVALTFPTGKPNQMLILRVRQDVTGGHTLSFTSGVSFSSDLPSPVISSAAEAVDYLGFIYSEADESWHYISEVKGF